MLASGVVVIQGIFWFFLRNITQASYLWACSSMVACASNDSGSLFSTPATMDLGISSDGIVAGGRDGKSVAISTFSGTDDGHGYTFSVDFYSLPDGAKISSSSLHQTGTRLPTANTIAMSPDASAVLSNWFLAVYFRDSGRQPLIAANPAASSSACSPVVARFSKDGKTVVAVCKDIGFVRWDLTDAANVPAQISVPDLNLSTFSFSYGINMDLVATESGGFRAVGRNSTSNDALVVDITQAGTAASSSPSNFQISLSSAVALNPSNSDVVAMATSDGRPALWSLSASKPGPQQTFDIAVEAASVAASHPAFNDSDTISAWRIDVTPKDSNKAVPQQTALFATATGDRVLAVDALKGDATPFAADQWFIGRASTAIDMVANTLSLWRLPS